MSSQQHARETWPLRLSRQLREQLRADERVLAEGRLIQGYVVVTDRRLVWMEGRRIISLPFDRVIQAQEIFEESHRYRLRFLHEPIDRRRDVPLPWDVPHHVRRWMRRRTWNRRTEFRFSRSNTRAAEAIRRGLDDAEVTLLQAVLRPHRRDESDGTLYRMGPLKLWWHRRRLSRLD